MKPEQLGEPDTRLLEKIGYLKIVLDARAINRVFYENRVHLIFANILVGAKHFGSKSLILTNKLSAEMLRPCQLEMHPKIFASNPQIR